VAKKKKPAKRAPKRKAASARKGGGSKPAAAGKDKGKVKKIRRPIPPLPKGVKEALVPVLPPEKTAPEKPAPATEKAPKRNIRDSEIEEIRQMLLERREEIMSELRADLHSPGGSERTRNADPTDQASDAAEGALSLALAQSESGELNQIEAALSRIDSGEFGLCDECGQAIPTERLKTLPYATTCIDCKRRLENASREEGLEEAWEALDESEEEAGEEEG
jgi:DnaK suppressor protein